MPRAFHDPQAIDIVDDLRGRQVGDHFLHGLAIAGVAFGEFQPVGSGRGAGGVHQGERAGDDSRCLEIGQHAAKFAVEHGIGRGKRRVDFGEHLLARRRIRFAMTREDQAGGTQPVEFLLEIEFRPVQPIERGENLGCVGRSADAGQADGGADHLPWLGVRGLASNARRASGPLFSSAIRALKRAMRSVLAECGRRRGHIHQRQIPWSDRGPDRWIPRRCR